MEQNLEQMLGAVFTENGLALSSEQAVRFSRLTDEMLRVNKQMNLTAVTDPKEIFVKHYADCASIAHLPQAGSLVCDIGAGAGFPTLPLAIMRPDLNITAVDSTEKRMRYVENTARLLGLKRVSVLTARAEDLGNSPEVRESFDFVTARAVAPLNILCELCLPLVKLGGRFCALKAVGGQDELAQATRAAECLGASVVSLKEFSLTDPFGIIPKDGLKRCVIVFEKVSPTPEKYPRRYAKIQSKPL